MDTLPTSPDLPPNIPPERPGVFERWFKRRKPATTEQQHIPEQPLERRSLRFAKGIRRVLNYAASTEREPQRAEAPEHPYIEDVAKTTRTLGEVTLKFVRGLLQGERSTAPIPEAGLQDAAEDLTGALGELNESMHDLPHSEASTAPHAEESPKTEAGDPMREVRLDSRAAEIHPLAETKEKVKKALVVAGLGAVAVGATLVFAIERRHAAKERRRHEQDLRSNQRLLKAERAQLRKQQKALERLQAVSPVPQQPERQQYFQQVSEFTHKQAEVTRHVAHEVRNYSPPATYTEHFQVPQPRSETTVRIEQSVQPAISERAAPLVTVENNDRVEHAAGRSNSQSRAPATGSVASGTFLPRAADQPLSQTPLNPQKVREQALRRSTQSRRLQFAWLVGLMLIAGAIVFLLIFMLFS